MTIFNGLDLAYLFFFFGQSLCPNIRSIYHLPQGARIATSTLLTTILFLYLDKSKVKAVGTSSTAIGKVAVSVQLLLTAIRARRLGVLAVTLGMGIHLLVAGRDINNGHVELGQLAALDTLNQDVGAVMVVLGGGISGPREREQTLVRVCAARHVLGDLDGPLVVDVGAGLGVLADDLPGLSAIFF